MARPVPGRRLRKAPGEYTMALPLRPSWTVAQAAQMEMEAFAVQYLEDAPGVAEIEPVEARARLRAAFERLPISRVLLGWNLPSALVEACREEAHRAGARLFRWHPLLTGDGAFVPRLEWRTVGLDGEPVPGFRGLPEFTFVCPNRPAVRKAVRRHLAEVIGSGAYDGVFLDRIRYPSPAADPTRLLACFCDDCCRVAADEGLDLEYVRQRIWALLSTPARIEAFVRVLLDVQASVKTDLDLAALRTFLDFRARSVSRFVRTTCEQVRARGLAIGLDCFSPALSYMVGQDLGALDAGCDWIKVMTYGHALGPAGLPFELLNLADWLVDRWSAGEPEALEWLSRAARLPLPPTRDALRGEGLAPEALAAETQRGRAAGVSPLFAGVELVEIEGLARLDRAQIVADLRAFRGADADGLVLSWDLWHIPLERLDLAREAWL